MKTCEKCGKPLKEGAVFCEFCGHFVPVEQRDEKAQEELEARSVVPVDKAANTVLSMRILGRALIVIGIVCDLLGMLMINSGSVESFGTVLFIGTVSFLVGLVLSFGGLL